MRKDEIERAVAEVKVWWHKIDVGHGVITPGTKQGNDFAELNLPDLHGKTVLDVGCWDGYYSFECERRGAKRVLATDHYAWHHFADGMKGFLTARELLHSKVEYKDIDIFDLSPETVGKWDVVLFLGVLYHLRNPLLALDRLAQITNHLLVVESHIVYVPLYHDIPLATFYEKDELQNDPSNWWSSNLECLIRMIRSAGFEYVEPQDPKNEKRVKRFRKFREKNHKAIVRELKRLYLRPKKRLSGTRATVHGWKHKCLKQEYTWPELAV